MPIKHGTSHGFATLISIIVSGLLVQLFSSQIPKVYNIIEGISSKICGFVNSMFSCNLQIEFVSTIIIATVLSAIWGVIFKFLHSD